VADRTVRAIFEAKVSGARKGLTDLSQDVAKTGKSVDVLTKDLKTLDAVKVKPDVDVKIDDAKKRLTDLKGTLADLKGMDASPEVDVKIADAQARIKEVRAEIKELTGTKVEVKVEAAIKDAEKSIKDLTLKLGELRTMEVTPEVTADIRAAERSLADARKALRELNAARAEMTVTADTKPAKKAIGDLAGDVADAGAEGGDDAGIAMVKGILAGLASIPIVGAVVGIGKAIAGGILDGIQQGLAIEAERDLFSARTGLDEATSARFGRAAGEAYANAWGDSIAGNLETARVALEQGLIDPDSVDADVEAVIASLSGIADIMQADIPEAARAAGQMIKTGLADNADEAFDILVAGYQNGADASQDLLDTFGEYSTHFRDLGLSGQEATGLLIQGLEGGAFNADKVADSLKELTIKVKELDTTAAPALEKLGLSGKEMQAAFTEGGPAARDALDQILTKLAAVEDPAERAKLAVGLFGTQAEDMAAALGNLNLDTAAAEMEQVGESAGAAERALATMSDNTASKMESAKRNVELAMDGIKGALAEAFSDEIGGAADWVAANRAPLMQFFLDVINGTFEMAGAFVEFSASALDAIADIAFGLAALIESIPFVDDSLSTALYNVGGAAAEAAVGIRFEIPAALDEAQAKANAWAAPELLKARIHDATMAMTADMDDFSATVDASGGTVTINGDKVNAEKALDLIVANINAEDGTVTINGDRVPAEDALDTIIRQIKAGKGDVTIGGDTGPAEGKLATVKGKISRSEASMTINANTGAAERALANLSRDRFAYLNIKVRGGTQLAGAHEGGWTGRLAPGLNAGGWVPGSDPGYDNILWPLNSGGRTLAQPLAGDEYVVNSKDSAYWGPVLEWMNGGGRPSSAPVGSGRMQIEGTVDIGGGVMGRLIGTAEIVEDFVRMAPTRSRMQAGVR